MILTAILLFSLAAFMGLVLVILGVRYRRGSLALGLGHASTALVALSILGVAVFRGPVNMIADDAALLLLLALGGGVVLLALREGKKPPPMIVVGIHASMALTGLLLLIYGYTHA